MTRLSIITLAMLAATAPALAQDEHRELGAHVHGVSTLEIAVEHGVVEMNLLSPGMDIVGFEHAASSADDRATVEAAIVQLGNPTDLFTFNAAAACRVSEVFAHLHGPDDHHDDAEDGDHDHEDDHDDHAEGDMHDEHEEGEDHDHDHGDHSEFHAKYAYSCANPDALSALAFPFFALYPNAQEIEVSLITDAGASQVEITRDGGALKLN